MGTSNDWRSSGLSLAHATALNQIGYHGKFKGERMTYDEYLKKHASTDTVGYSVVQTRFDQGDFVESYMLTKAEYRK